MPTIKNILIFVSILAVFALIYIFVIKPKIPAPVPSLVSSTFDPASPGASTSGVNLEETQDFLNLLLNVKSIKLDDTIFSDSAFLSVSKHDSSIVLVPDGKEGRNNPFAQFGVDDVAGTPPVCVLPKVLDKINNACIDPPPVCVLPKILDKKTNTCVNPPKP